MDDRVTYGGSKEGQVSLLTTKTLNDLFTIEKTLCQKLRYLTPTIIDGLDLQTHTQKNF